MTLDRAHRQRANRRDLVGRLALAVQIERVLEGATLLLAAGSARRGCSGLRPRVPDCAGVKLLTEKPGAVQLLDFAPAAILHEPHVIQITSHLLLVGERAGVLTQWRDELSGNLLDKVLDRLPASLHQEREGALVARGSLNQATQLPLKPVSRDLDLFRSRTRAFIECAFIECDGGLPVRNVGSGNQLLPLIKTG